MQLSSPIIFGTGGTSRVLHSLTSITSETDTNPRSISSSIIIGDRKSLTHLKVPHPIHKLPTELLQEIFVCRIHRATHVRPISPVLLLLVCRKWYNVADATAELWTNIMFWHDVLPNDPFIGLDKSVKGRYAALKEAAQRAIVCHSPTMLSRTILRAGSLKFDLAIMDDGISMNAEDVGTSDGIAVPGIDYYNRFYWEEFNFSLIQTRCRSLDIWHATGFFNCLFRRLSALGGMVALENLHYRRNLPPQYPLISNKLLNNIATGSPKLQNFQLSSTQMEYRDSSENARWKSKVLPRLKRFTLILCREYTTVLKGDLRALEELDINVERMADVTHPSSHLPHLKSLTIRNGNLDWIVEGLYDQLISLSLDYRMTSPISIAKKVLLPRLENLYISGYWGFVKWIEAPNLERLTLCDMVISRGDQKYWPILTGLEDFEVATDANGSPAILPRILHVEISRPDEALIKVLKEAWVGLEELHMTCLEYLGLGDTIEELLLNGHGRTLTVEQTEENPAPCSMLQKLVVLAPFSSFFTSDYDVTREELVRALERVIEARQAEGMDNRKELWNAEWERLL